MKLHIMHPDDPRVPEHSKKMQRELYHSAVKARHEESFGPGSEHYEADKAHSDGMKFDEEGNIK